MTEIKDGRGGPISYALPSATGLAPGPVERRIVDLFSGKGTAIVTNVPGPVDPVYFGRDARADRPLVAQLELEALAHLAPRRSRRPRRGIR